MSVLFISHSSKDNAAAVALVDWLNDQGWNEIFLDLSPERGLAAGQRWERALTEAASRCEAVLCVVSRNWLASSWCQKERELARKLNKRLFGVLIEDISVADLPPDLTESQLVRLASGRDHVVLRAVLPITHEEVLVTFSTEGLRRLKRGLEAAGLDPRYFEWPPPGDPDRAPYRGLHPLEAEDAGVFFGREAPVLEALDRLRGLREASPPRMLVILGASGAGKSSFLRAGLIPRLARDDRNFLPLPVMRPERSAISGATGLIHVLEEALRQHRTAVSRADVRAAVAGGLPSVRPLLQRLMDMGTPLAADGARSTRPPTLIISVDQAEELFLADGKEEAHAFLVLMRDLLIDDTIPAAGLFAIRSDSYERLQVADELKELRQQTFSLQPMPRGSFAEVIRGPARRLEGSSRPLRIQEALVEKLLADIEEGGGRDTLPLLSFTLERLYLEHGGDADLTLQEYGALNGIKGSIELAVERAFQAADADPRIPRDREARLALLRRGLIPWLAGIDPDTKAPRRHVARLSEIPPESLPLIQLLVAQRLLATDRDKNGEETIEPVHEALLRQWGVLAGWLREDAAPLAILDGVKRASRDWSANARNTSWLAHTARRLSEAERLRARPDLTAQLEPTDWEYLAACRALYRRRRSLQLGAVALAVGGAVAIAWPNGERLSAWFWLGADTLWPKSLSPAEEQRLQAKQVFQECFLCPEMVVIPAGQMVRRVRDSEDQQQVTIARPFAVSRHEITFDQWQACVAAGGCLETPRDQGWGRGSRPVINVSWNEVLQYVTWLSRKTGRNYRLPSEAEWEYAARAGTSTTYPWGDQVGRAQANCNGCGSEFDGKRTAPVGSFPANAFGLHDMLGNAWEWVQDCFVEDYRDAPRDGSPVPLEYCDRRTFRGGSWLVPPMRMTASSRMPGRADFRGPGLTFRVARHLQ